MATCVISKIDSNATSTFIAEEECLKVLPGVDGQDAVWQNLEIDEFGTFGGEVETLARNPISQSRQNKKGGVVDKNASAAFTLDFTKSNLNKWLQGFFFADARQAPSTAPFNGVHIPITAVEADGYTGVGIHHLFNTGDIVMAQGFANPDNNGMKVVETTPQDTITLVAGTALTPDAAPAEAAVLARVGAQLPADYVNFEIIGGLPALVAPTGQELDSYGTLFPGKWVFIGGDDPNSRFAKNVGFARVLSVSETQIVFDDTTFKPEAESGVGKSIQLFTGNVIKNEDDPDLIKLRSYQLERVLGKGGFNDYQAEYVVGAVANNITVNIENSTKVTAELEYVGLDTDYRNGNVDNLRKPGKRLPAPGEQFVNAGDNVYRMKMQLVDETTSDGKPLFAYLRSATIAIGNGVTPDKAVGEIGGFGVSLGNFEVTGEAVAYFQTVEALRAIQESADASFNIICAVQNAGFIFDIPLLTIGSGGVQVAKNEPVLLNVENNGAENKHGYTLLYQWFDYLPNVAMKK